MIKWHIDNEFTKFVKGCARFNELTEEEHVRLYSEVRNVVLQGIEKKLMDPTSPGDRVDNKQNSLLLWVIGATDIKATGPQKIASKGSYADFDVDFSQERRDEIKEYLKERWNDNRVSDVVTFSKMAAKGAVRSAQRALGYPIDLGNKIAKYIPEIPGIKLQEAIDASKPMQEIIAKDPNAKEIINIALKLEGLPQALSQHACAFVITDVDTTEYMPLMISTKKDGGNVLTQYEYYDVEALGCLKVDLLGLKTLDVIDGTVKLVKQRQNIDIDIESIDVNDPGIYSLINDGHNCGIFQFESDIFKSAVANVKPANINEISDLTSLLRPGPLSMGMLDQYIDAKFKGAKYEYKLSDKNLINKVWEICSTSYGLMVYQEQVIKCFTEIGGFNEIEGDNARRAMGKKKEEEMKKLEQMFVAGGKKKGYNEKDLSTLFHQIEGFAGYGFNKSHAICYSFITAYTAYLSNYYPLEFYTTLLTIDSGKTDDVRRYINAVKKRGFKVSAPRCNTSDVDFTISGKDTIIFGIAGIKGVGKAISGKILKRRPKRGYKSLGNFIIKNVDLLNKKILEQYAKAGMFADFNINKASALDSTNNILNFMDSIKSVEEYETIFDLIPSVDVVSYIDNCLVTNNNAEDDMNFEIETLGFYITKHPLEGCQINPRTGALDVKDLNWLANEDRFISVGAICAIDIRKTKNKTNMAIFDLTSPDNSVRCTVFPKTYEKYIDLIKEGNVVAVAGIAREEGDESNNEDGKPSEKTFMISEISEKWGLHVLKIEEKKSNPVDWIEIDKITESSPNEIGIRINEKLSYILRR